MAERIRLAAAGLFLALALAVVPMLVPLNFAGADPGHPSLDVASTTPPVQVRDQDVAPRPAPSEPPLNPVASQAAAPAHMVAPGESLWKISRDTGIGVEALATANHLTIDAVLYPGQVLAVPPADAAPSKDTRAATPAAPREGAPGETLVHRVAPGETLWGIARAAGLHVETLATVNHISLDDLLYPGQALVVPMQDGPLPPSAGTRRLRVRSVRGPVGPRGAGSPALYEAVRADFGSLLRPSDGRITSRFGWRIHPIFGTREFHTGVDIANRHGTPIRAAEDGIVRFAGWMGGYGRLVILVHRNGLETSYSHLSALLVTLGQRVVKGQIVGRMGSTGWSTGPHLLFEVRLNGVPLDPTPFLQDPASAITPAPAPQEHPMIEGSPSGLNTAPVP